MSMSIKKYKTFEIILYILGAYFAHFIINNKLLMYSETILLLFTFFLIITIIFGYEATNVKLIINSKFTKLYLFICFFYILRIKGIYSINSENFYNNNLYMEIIGLLVYYIVFIAAASLREDGNFSVKKIYFNFLLWLILFGITAVEFKNNDIHNMNYYGYICFIALPLIFIIDNQRVVTKFCLILLITASSVYFQSRLVVAACMIFLFTKYVYPKIHKEDKAGSIYIIILIVILIFISMYVILKNSSYYPMLEELSLNLTGKGLFGRAEIWNELLLKVKNKLLLGYCSSCSSESIFSEKIQRNLSSHNSWLEFLFRGGIIFYLIIVCAIYSLYEVNKSKIIYAMILSMCILMTGYEFLFFSTMVPNTLIWITLGLVINSSTKNNLTKP